MATRLSRQFIPSYQRDSHLWRTVGTLAFLVLALTLVMMVIAALIPR